MNWNCNYGFGVVSGGAFAVSSEALSISCWECRVVSFRPIFSTDEELL